jgi:hypothetical protein
MKSMLDKIGLIPVPFAMAACMLATAMVAGCTADTYAGGDVLQVQDGCHARVQQFVQPVYAQQFVAPVYQQQLVQRVYVPRQQVVIQQVQQHHHRQQFVQQLNGHQRQAVIVQRVEVQRPQRQQIIRQRTVTRIR